MCEDHTISSSFITPRGQGAAAPGHARTAPEMDAEPGDGKDADQESYRDSDRHGGDEGGEGHSG